MHYSIVFVFCACMLSLSAKSQSTSIEIILAQVEQNNKELQALAAFADSKRLELQSTNNLPDPQFVGYYLPFGGHTSGDYTEFEISQSFEFPSVYGARSNLIDQRSAQFDLAHKVKRQEILLQAKSYCLELVYLNKRLIREALRVEQAEQVYNQMQELFAKEQVGILEANKAKVAWLQERFNAQQIESDRQNLLLLLSNLNGGNEVLFSTDEYTSDLKMAGKDSVWQDRLIQDPGLLHFKKEEAVARLALELAKKQSLPHLTVGLNTQGYSGERYSGFFAGVDIPLWNNRYKVEAAESRVFYKHSATTSLIMKEYASFEKQYNDYQIMLIKFQDYQTTLSDLNSDELLLQAYELGGMSFLEYYMELQFYRQAYDSMLEMQYQLHLTQAELLDYQL